LCRRSISFNVSRIKKVSEGNVEIEVSLLSAAIGRSEGGNVTRMQYGRDTKYRISCG